MTIDQIQSLIDEKIPEGLVVPNHTEDAHFYMHRLTGKIYASVTTKSGILDTPHLKQWAARLAVDKIRESLPYLNEKNQESIFEEAQHAHKDVLNDAGDVGTRGHDVIEQYLLEWIKRGEKPKSILDFIPKTEHDARIWAITRSAEQFCTDWDVQPVRSELLVASTKYGYAGTLDALMIIDGKLCIVDWKTSNTVDKPEYAMQVSAYWKAFTEMVGKSLVKKMYIVQLDKKKMKYKVVEVRNRQEAFRAFVHVSKAYDWLNNPKPYLIDLSRKTGISLEQLSAKS